MFAASFKLLKVLLLVASLFGLQSGILKQTNKNSKICWVFVIHVFNAAELTKKLFQIRATIKPSGINGPLLWQGVPRTPACKFRPGE